jgi:quinol monooxygenase YgiN
VVITVIVRIFKALVINGELERWQQQVEDYSIPWLEAQEGMLACYPGKPLGDEREFVMVSLWRDLDSLRAAVGDNWTEVALFEDEASLVESVAVDHYESFGLPEA